MIVTSSPHPVDLLEAEFAVIWSEGRRDPEAPPSVVIGDAVDGLVLAVRSDLPPELTDRVRRIVADRPARQVPVAVVEALRPELGPLEVTVGPCYDCSDPAPQPTPTVGRLIRSDHDDPDADGLRVPPTWEPEDWRRLLAGAYGPWALVATADRVLSLCHSARLAPAGVEAGVWTADDVRGMGLAAAATAAWADSCRSLPGHVFYSTSTVNRSSQAVAARLRLPLIGRLWKLRPAGEGDGPAGSTLRVVARLQ